MAGISFSSSQSSPFSFTNPPSSSTASPFYLGSSTASPFSLGSSTPSTRVSFGSAFSSSFSSSSSTSNPTSTSSFTNPQNAIFASSSAPFFGSGSSSSSAPSPVPSFRFGSSSPFAPSSTASFGFVISSSSASSTTVAPSPSLAPASSPLGFGPAPSAVSSGSSLFGSLASTTSSLTAPFFPNLFSSNSNSSSSSPFSLPNGSPFSQFTQSSASTTISSSPSSFSMGPPSFSPFQSSLGFNAASSSVTATAVATVSSSPATKTAASVFGTSTAPLFSTITPFILPSTAQSGSTVAPSGTVSSFSGFGVISVAATSVTTGSFPSISLPTNSTVPASSQDQSTTPAPVFSEFPNLQGVPFYLHSSSAGCSARFLMDSSEGEEVIQGEDEQFRNEVVKQPLAQPVEQKAVEGLISVIREDKNQREAFDREMSGVQESVAFTPALVSGLNSASAPTVPLLVSAATSAIAPTVATIMTPEPRFVVPSSVGAMPSGENVEGGKETGPITVKRGVNSESDVSASVVAKRAKTGVCRVGTQTLPLQSQHIDVNDYLSSPENGLIVKRILEKYGDVTAGSILNGMAAKFAILDLVADAVCRMCSHTIKTLGPDDLQLIEANTEDAAAVGFNMEWLRERVDKVILARNYQVRLTELDKLGQEIEITKKSLTEMEHRHMDLKMVVAAIKDEMEVKEAWGSSLGEGL